MARKLVLDPVTRIEGHLRFDTRIENQQVVEARATADMFRGMEKAMIGYDARAPQQITQRVCGVCPYAHAEAASLALESAMGLRPNANGQLLRNLTVGAYQIQDYLLHFYHLCALDFIDVAAVLSYRGRDATLVQLRDWVQAEVGSNRIFPAAPFLPRYEADYCTNRELNHVAIRNYAAALPVMAGLHKAVALFGGKAPHPVALEAGGVTTMPSLERLAAYRSFLADARRFVETAFVPDVVGVAGEFPGYFAEGRSYGNFLSYPYLPDAEGQNHRFAGGATINGRFEALDLDRIYEDHRYAFYDTQPETEVRPLQQSQLHPIDYERFKREMAQEDGKYSWTRAPRYAGHVMEVGPVARVVNTYAAGTNPRLTELVDSYNAQLGLRLEDYNSVMGRHLSRMICVQVLLDEIERDLDLVEPEKPAFTEHAVPRNARGFGLTEATRGALGHWIQTDAEGYVANYDMIVPTTWNISPRDASGQPGAVERMLIGTRLANPDQPIELARIIRSTDPCMACSVH